MSNLLLLLNPQNMEGRSHPFAGPSALLRFGASRRSPSALEALEEVDQLEDDFEEPYPDAEVDDASATDPHSSHTPVSPIMGGEGPEHEPHENCPDSLDCLPDTEGKPQHTLPIILRSAILGSKKKKLTIRDIYAEMERKYPYFKTAGPAWKQSVRHHLSLSRLFERQERPASAPGHGSYWTVNLNAPPGTKRPRKRGRPKKDAEQAEGTTKKQRATDYHMVVDKEPSPSMRMDSGQVAGASHHTNVRQRIMDGSCSPPLLSAVSSRHRSPMDVTPVDAPAPAMGMPPPSKEDDELRSNPLNPRSPSPFPSPLGPSPSTTSCSTTPDFERLIEENRELKKEVVSVFNRMARMASDLSEAHTEIARLRARNETLERQSTGW